MKMKKWLQDKFSRPQVTPPLEDVPAASWTQTGKKHAFDEAFKDFHKLIALQGNNAPNYRSELQNFKENHDQYLKQEGALTALIARENRIFIDTPKGADKATIEAMKAIEEDIKGVAAPRPK